MTTRPDGRGLLRADGLTAALAVGLAVGLAARLGAQDEPTPTLKREYTTLLQRLRDRNPPTRRQCIDLLRGFLSRHQPRAPVSPAQRTLLIKVRIRLARTLLLTFRGEQAIKQFNRALAEADDKAPAHRQLRGRAIYGVAQAQEMIGRVQASRTTLTRLEREFEDTRYGRFAEIAAQRLQRIGRTQMPGNGDMAPAFGPLLDVGGRSVNLASLQQRPALLMFWSPEVKSSMRHVERMAQEWQKAGGDRRQVLAFAVHEDRARIHEAATRRGWSCAVIPCATDFLDPVVLAYGVDGVPTTVLLGPDGMILGRDQSAAEIRSILKRLKKR